MLKKSANSFGRTVSVVSLCSRLCPIDPGDDEEGPIVFRYGQSDSWADSMNPYAYGMAMSDTLFFTQTHEYLLQPDQDLKLEGRLAEDWDVSEDGRPGPSISARASSGMMALLSRQKTLQQLRHQHQLPDAPDLAEGKGIRQGRRNSQY